MKTKQSTLIGMFLLILMLLIFFSCGKSSSTPEEARIKLGQMGIKYSADSFIEKIKENDIIAVKLFLDAGMNPNMEIEGRGSTPLLLAVGLNKYDIAKIIIESGADVNYNVPKVGVSALFASIFRLNYDCTKLLLNKGANTKWLIDGRKVEALDIINEVIKIGEYSNSTDKLPAHIKLDKNALDRVNKIKQLLETYK